MNVWIVNHYAIPPNMGGLVRHYYFSKYLQKKGHTVKIFTSSKIHNTEINMISDKSLYREEMEDGIEYTFVRSRDYKGNGLDRIFNMMDLPFKTWKTMRKFLDKQKPDVIYTSSPDLFVAYFALLFGRKYKIPVVVEVRDLWPESIVEYKGMSRKNPIIQVLYQLEKWIYKKADQLIFTMEGGKDYIRDKGWDKAIDLEKVNHVNNGVDLEEFEKNKEKYVIQDEDLEDTSHFKIVYMGSIRLVNNLGTLVEAGKVLKERGIRSIKILVYGDGTEKEYLEQKSQTYGINLVFKGRVEKKFIPYILSKADANLINVKNSELKKYGCSWNKLFEYMASGKPIISNLVMGYDIINKYHCGISRNMNSAEEYADLLLSLSKLEEKEYGEMCENARRGAKDYNYITLTDKIIDIIQKAVRK
ncbi:MULTISPECIES: glycosyltransferase family 4 protein [Lachnospiraceae]|uniref:Glycosyltransferase family 4 protein n=1 Tax=Faecalicatena acetigenes TaxID=2981790 RepID=A0ABT2TBZ1_9FIRM|nr:MULTISPECIES: glycosyltransferase family 4 protein [Lachnospiraceae]MCU6747755.1 glycosyltransferase family 4 protein [Faecalicatena acetigenes]SCI07602.1 putative glycosyl transferase [uncultured Clostridium sp.]